jgi:glycine hydroxymethyltransferase
MSQGSSSDSTFFGSDFAALSAQDPEIAEILLKELERQRTHLQLIASENFTSPAVLTALGSTLSNKYAEGYPGKRYYGGCEVVDIAEEIGIARAKELFGAEHANLQPHSGASANVAVYQAFTKPGDTVLAMSLAEGGHLTHGSKVNFSGKWFNVVSYGVRKDDERIDYDELERLAHEHKPKMICSGATAYPSLIDFERIRKICDAVGAIMWVDAAHFIGLVAGKAIPSPVPYADVVSFTTHKVLRGPRGGMILSKAEHAAAIDKAVFPGMQGGPIMSAVAAKAVALKECMQPEYQKYARDVITNAKALAAALEHEGMRAVSGGTETHLALIDVRSTGVNGKVADERCGRSGITLNKNAIPFDPEKPSITSGIRVGTPATTTQGMGVDEMSEIAALIKEAIQDGEDDAKAKAIASRVAALTSKFPVYPRSRNA